MYVGGVEAGGRKGWTSAGRMDFAERNGGIMDEAANCDEIPRQLDEAGPKSIGTPGFRGPRDDTRGPPPLFPWSTIRRPIDSSTPIGRLEVTDTEDPVIERATIPSHHYTPCARKGKERERERGGGSAKVETWKETTGETMPPAIGGSLAHPTSPFQSLGNSRATFRHGARKPSA